MQYKKVLTIAGSDSGGGAGIQADIKVISACGCYASTAITAITVQNTLGVEAVHPVPIEYIEGQINAVLSDIGADAIKIGMLHSREVILAVKKCLEKFNIKNIVLDPVMVSTSGHKLMEDEAIETLKSELICNARIITPNLPEAEVLLNRKINSASEFPEIAKKLSFKRKVSVFLKGGHLEGDVLADFFYNAETNETLTFQYEKTKSKNKHGTGCSLSSALASFLAHNYSLNEAVYKAKEYIDGAVISGAKYEIGKGHGPIHHFYKFWK